MRSAGCSTVAGMLVALAALVALLVPAARAAAPPDNIVLIYPVAPVPLGDRFQLGFAVSADVVPGLLTNITVFLAYPDGNVEPLFSLEEGYQDEASCTYDGAGAPMVAIVSAEQVGSYTAYWNVSYTLSADPMQANATYCGPPPFSTQSWGLSAGFAVSRANASESATGSVAPAGAATATFPSQPTGSVSYSITAASATAKSGAAAKFGPMMHLSPAAAAIAAGLLLACRLY